MKEKSKIKPFSETGFVTFNKTAILRPDENGHPVFEEEIKTYKVQPKNNKFIIYEIISHDKEIKKKIRGKTVVVYERTSKPKRIKTIKKSKKYSNVQDVVASANRGEFKLKTHYTEKLITKENNVIIKNHYNYFPSTIHPVQMVASVYVSDVRRKISAVMVGYSSFHSPQKSSIEKMKDDCTVSAVSRFVRRYGQPRSSGDIVTEILDVRFQTWIGG